MNSQRLQRKKNIKQQQVNRRSTQTKKSSSATDENDKSAIGSFFDSVGDALSDML